MGLIRFKYWFPEKRVFSIIEGSLEVKLPTIWTDEKQSWGEMKNYTPMWRGAHYSTFPSQNVQNTPWSDHFWKLRCRKSARRCGAKHISIARSTFRSQNVKKCLKKHQGFGPLLEGQMLLRVAGARDCAPCQK